MTNEFQSISLKATKVWKLHALILYAVITLLLLGFGWIFITSIPLMFTLGTIVLLLFIIDFYFLSVFKQRNFKYRINADTIEISSGRLFYKSRSIPIQKVAYVKQKEGLIIRKYGLVNLELGTVVDAVEIPCLTKETANFLQDKMQQKQVCAQTKE